MTFYAADVNKFLYEYPDYQNKIHTIILDPPRAGISGKALKRVIELNAPHLVYVSCNPSTQARDIEILSEAGYKLQKLSLVDQFPHTAHVEAIATAAHELVEKRDAWLNPPGATEAELKKRTLTNLYNQRPTWLDLAHKKLDTAVLAVYGWPDDLTDEQILERLLALNLERAGEVA